MTLAPRTALINPTQVITQDLYDRFISYIDAKPKTVKTYTTSLKQFFNWTAEHNIRQPQFMDIKQYRDDLISSGKKATTLYAYIFVVRLFFQWTDAEGIYPNVAGKIKGASIPQEPKKEALTRYQARELIHSIDNTTIKGKRDKAIIALMLTCGLRDIEVIRANVSDIDTTSGQPRLYVQGKGKDDKGDYVKLPEGTLAIIRDYLDSRCESTDILFTSEANRNYGERLTTTSISRICKEAMRNIGIDNPRYTAHSFRHTSITISLLENNRDIQATKQFARHSNINTTLIYAHNLDKADNNCSNLIANCIL